MTYTMADMTPSEDVLAEDLKDQTFRDEWERTAVARAVALAVLDYRTRHGLSQRALAVVLGVRQPQVACLESGDHHPSIETLRLLSSRLGLEIAIIFTPPTQNVSEHADGFCRRKDAIIETGEGADGSRIVAIASKPRDGTQRPSRRSTQRGGEGKANPAAV